MKFLCLFFFFSLSIQAQAAQGFMAGVGLLYTSEKTEGSSISNSEFGLTEYNAKVGYLSGSLYYGLLIDSLTKDYGDSTATRNSTGLVIGYHGKAWYLDAVYFISSEYQSIGGAKLKEGSGFGADIGYNFLKDSTTYFINAQLSYKSFEYKKVASVSAVNKINSEIYPMLVFGMTFAR